MANTDGVIDRKIRGIIEAVDSRQFKNGFKLANALLAKYPYVSHAMALKALLLERMERYEEALAVCFEAKARIFTEAIISLETLNTLQTVCQRLDRLDLATECYENACGKLPTSIDHLMGLFNCHIHEYSFVKQQKTALRMYKLLPEERHLLWAICSIQLQVFGSDEPDRLLNLAELLLNRHNTTYGLKEPEAILMYISVLEQRAKYSDALAILSGVLGAQIVLEVDRLRIKGRLLARACDYTKAAEVFGNLLEACPDDWDCFLHYLSCLLEDGSMWSGGTTHDQIHPSKLVDRKLSHLSDEVFDVRMSTASDLVRSLKPAPGRTDIIRCPHLALLEIETRKFLQGRNDSDRLIKALINYFRRFGQLACFTSDVEMFLQVLTMEETTELVERFKLLALSGNGEVQILAQKITLFKLQDLLGIMFELSLDELEIHSVILTELYIESLPLSKKLDIQENMHGEELLSLASNVLVQLFWRTQHLGYLLEAIFILEFGLTVRRYISQYKILLVHLYSHLGAFQLAYEWYKSLEIKNILLETVSHHMLPQMLTSPFWVDSTYLLEEYLSFLTDHFGESADLTYLAYRHRNYSKVIEFVQFRNRLQHSHKYLMARLDTPILQLKQKADKIEEAEHALQSSDSGSQLLELSSEKNCNSLTYNEDMQTRPWWSPTPDINYLLEPFEERSIRPGLGDKNLQWQQEQSKKQEAYQKIVIKRKSLLPRLIYLSLQSASSFLKENVGSSSSESNNNNSEFFSLLKDYAGSLGFSFDDAVDMVVGISNGQKSFQEVSSSGIVDWMNFAVFLNAWKLGSQKVGLPDEDGGATGYWKMVDSLFKKLIEEKITSNQDLIRSPGVHLTGFVQMVTEPLAWHSLVMQSCIRLLVVSSGKKKKKSKPAEQLTSPLSQAILSSIESLCGTLEVVTKQLREHIDRSEEQDLDTIVSLLPNIDWSEGRPAAPGRVFGVLRNLSSSLGSTENLSSSLGSTENLSSSLGSTEVKYGIRILNSLQSWDAVEVGRKIIKSLKATLSEFLKICDMKLTLLQGLKQQLEGLRK